MVNKQTAANAIGKGKPGPGRPKGSANKTTKAAREAFALAFDAIGGAKALAKWARDNETEFYKLYARLIPVEVSGDPDTPIQHVHRVIRWGSTEIPL